MNSLKGGYIKQCRIYYRGMLISQEKILQDLMSFLLKNENGTSVVLHTGSVCFDVIATVAAVIKAIMLNELSNDDVFKSLEEGDYVILRYPNGYVTRRIWVGITKKDGEEQITLKQLGSGKDNDVTTWMSKAGFAGTIWKYNGDSKETNSKGLEQQVTNRDEFLARLFGVDASEIPVTLEAAIMVVSDKERFEDILDNTEIFYENKKSIKLSDLAPVAYRTKNGEERRHGANPVKARPLIVYTERASVARDYMFDNRGKPFGISILKEPYGSEGYSDIDELAGSNLARFVDVSVQAESGAADFLINSEKEMAVFGCVGEEAEQYMKQSGGENELTKELKAQVKSALTNRLQIVEVSGGVSAEDYRELREKIKKLEWHSNKKDDFKLSAFALMKLMNTACFTMEEVESMVGAGLSNNRVVSPSARLAWMQEAVDELPSTECQEIINRLSEMYEGMFAVNEKKNKLLEILVDQPSEKKILVVVSKAYYIDVMRQDAEICKYGNVEFVTTGRYNPNLKYDLIIAMSGVDENRFNPFKCIAAKDVIVLVYDSEKKLVSYVKKRGESFRRKIALRMAGAKVDDEKFKAENKVEEETDKVLAEYSDFDDMVRQLQIDNAINNIGNYSRGVSGESGQMTDVYYAGSFVTGENIMFTKYYSAVVFDEGTGTVEEKSVEELTAGDTMIFMNNNQFTQNIVDFIFGELLRSGKMTDVVMEAYSKSLEWKKILREYKDVNKLSLTKLAEMFNKKGHPMHQVTIGMWLLENSHIIGPRDALTLKAIAEVTENQNLLENYEDYYEACRVVRQERRRILKMIAIAIRDKLNGNEPKDGGIEKMIYQNIDKMSEMLELMDVVELPEPREVMAYMANRPMRVKED